MGKYDDLMSFSIPDTAAKPTMGKYDDLMSFDLKKEDPIPKEDDKETYLGRIGSVVKDIPKTFGDAWERTKERAERTFEPTELGKLAPEGIARETLAAPERVSRAVLGTAGTVGEVVGVPAEIATKGVNALLGGKPGKIVQKTISKGIESDAGQKIVKAVTDWWGSLDESAKANYGSLPDVLDIVGMKGSKVALKSSVPKLEGVVEKGISKGVKPTVVGKKTLPRYEKFYKKSEEAVKAILENKNLKIVDDTNEVVAYPKTSGQFAQAIDKTKKDIYKQYHSMATKAGDQGAKFDLSNITNKLAEISDTKNLEVPPKIRKYASDLFDEIAELDGAAPDIIEARIADLNSSLKGFYEGRVSKGKAQVDASVANEMRKQLDKQIMEKSGEGYQALKKKYGALLEIEKEVNHRAIVNARKANKGLLDFTDIFTGGDLAAGIVTMNPALITRGAFGKGLKEIFKTLNDPDKAIAKMFKDAAKTPVLKEVGIIKQPGSIIKGSIRSLRELEDEQSNKP